MNRTKLLVLGLVFILIFAGGCSKETSFQQESQEIIIESFTTNDQLTTQQRMVVTAKVTDKEEKDLSYNWSAEKGEIKSKQDTAVYQAPASVGKDRLILQVSNANGASVTRQKEIEIKAGAEDEVTTLENEDLTLTYPEEIKVNQAITFSGETSSSVAKVIVKVDGYQLSDSNTGQREIEVSDNQYSLSYSFSQQSRGRKLEVLALDQRGNVINSLTDSLDIKGSGSFTLNRPDQIYAGHPIEFSGSAANNIEKVMLTVDGYILTDLDSQKKLIPLNGSDYQIRYSFHQPGDKRDLIITGLDQNNQIVEEKRTSIDVLKAQEISINHPQRIFNHRTTEFSGEVSDQVVEVRAKVDGYPLIDTDEQEVFSVSGNQYNFNYIFSDTGQNRELTVIGYDDTGSSIATTTKKIDVLHFKEQLTLEAARQVEIEEPYNISGQALGSIESITILLDEYILTEDYSVEDESYEFKTTFNTPDRERNLVVKGFDSQGNKVKEVSQKINVIEDNSKNLLHGRTIVIDAGHGGIYPGAVGYTGLQEKVVVLSVAKKLEALLNQTQAQVIMTRSGDYNVSLGRRSRIANNVNADFFLSIHANAATRRGAHGTEHFISRNASRASIALANRLQSNIVNRLNTRNIGVKRRDFYVLRNTYVPAVLSEIAFLSNPSDEAMLKNKANREATAEAMYDAIVDYFE